MFASGVLSNSQSTRNWPVAPHAGSGVREA
jgi:hypothetical protein